MHRWLGVASWLAVVCVLTPSAVGQLREIDSAKLPEAGGTRIVYAQLGAFERYGQAWTNTWAYDVPKERVAATFMSSLAELTKTAESTPNNHELQLLTGLVAHFAYNVDVEAAYGPAMKFLHEAALSDPADYRTDWFLGMQECQANQGDKGMPLLLGVEESMAWQKLPVDFWNDYVTCATVTRMPAHSLRAIGRAIEMGVPPQSFQVMKGMNERAFKTSDAKSTYPAREVWAAEGVSGEVVFTSRLCGVSFAAHGNWAVNPYDVKNGTCAVVIEPPKYPAKVGKSSPSLMLMSQAAEPGETLADFAAKFLKGRVATQMSDELCPAASCLGYEVLDKEMYANQGGAHLLVVAFEREMPEFDGLIFERAEGPPKPKENNKFEYFTADAEYRRFAGPRYYLVLLDSNAAIFAAAKQDFDFFVKSMRVE